MKTFKQLQEEVNRMKELQRIAAQRNDKRVAAGGKGREGNSSPLNSNMIKSQDAQKNKAMRNAAGTGRKLYDQKRMKSSAIVPTNKTKPNKKEYVGRLKNATTPSPRGGEKVKPDRITPKGGDITKYKTPIKPKPEQAKPSQPNKKPDGHDLGKMARGALGSAWNAVKKAKTTQKGQPMSRGGRVDAPKRGVYNG